MTAAWDPQARWKSNRSLEIYISSHKSCKMHTILILNVYLYHSTLVDLAQEDLSGIEVQELSWGRSF